jgi:predicted TIM-barrel fold metal-dependent hydrolase
VFPGAVQTFVAKSGLRDDTRRAILGDNAAALLGLGPATP